MKYDRVFVHAGEMEKRGEEYEFLEEDEHGFLHGEIRIEAIKILKKQGKVKEIIIVGGPTKDGASKVQLIAKRIGGEVIELESIVSTGGNVDAIKDYLAKVKNKGRNGLLTNFYHLPRALRLINNDGFKLKGICAESVLLTDNPGWMKKIEEWYSRPSMLKRTLSEIQGLKDIEAGSYQNGGSKKL